MKRWSYTGPLRLRAQAVCGAAHGGQVRGGVPQSAHHGYIVTGNTSLHRAYTLHSFVAWSLAPLYHPVRLVCATPDPGAAGRCCTCGSAGLLWRPARAAVAQPGSAQQRQGQGRHAGRGHPPDAQRGGRAPSLHAGQRAAAGAPAGGLHAVRRGAPRRGGLAGGRGPGAGGVRHAAGEVREGGAWCSALARRCPPVLASCGPPYGPRSAAATPSLPWSRPPRLPRRLSVLAPEPRTLMCKRLGVWSAPLGEVALVTLDVRGLQGLMAWDAGATTSAVLLLLDMVGGWHARGRQPSGALQVPALQLPYPGSCRVAVQTRGFSPQLHIRVLWQAHRVDIMRWSLTCVEASCISAVNGSPLQSCVTKDNCMRDMVDQSCMVMRTAH